MILVRCIRNVFERSLDLPIEWTDRCLFKKDYFYMVEEDEEGKWLTRDEENELHIIADGHNTLDLDDWFHEHFILL
ncbi:hypothetical protein GMB86_02860 [Terrilactibacillus sp. BCM23-1]|uniref:Uncharacterized protein n=1 Tax=Terrilactibacillus tamarindi TaxID=2599694 RepID=A0A6N8CPX0_9BACI|nr:hypothetical protein [Terrilactibacillus tamarindi]MTT30955.1 hypothetical protein [Terrilactibacillus tamarindi]